MTIKFQVEHNISKFCNTGLSRYSLGNVNVNSNLNRLEATDGKVLVTVPIDCNGDTFDRSFQLNGKALNKVVSKKNSSAILQKKDDRFSLFSVDDTSTVEVDEVIEPGRFPKCDTIIEDTAKPSEKIGELALDGNILKKIADYAAKSSKKDRATIKFELYADCLKFTIDTNSGPAVGVLIGITIDKEEE